MQRPIACAGASITVVYAVCDNGTAPGNLFFLQLEEGDQAKMAALFSRMAQHGRISNEQKFKHIEGSEFFEFKSHQVRMLCYYLPGRLLVITHGFKKKGNRIPKEHITRAERIQKEDTARFSQPGGTRKWTN